MRIESCSLAAALKEALEEKTLLPCEVPEYVIEHIFKPLRQDRPLFFRDLDFEAFTADDIRALEIWLEQQEAKSSRLAALGNVFCCAQPASRPGRMFC